MKKANDFSDVDGTGAKIAMITDTGGINDQSFNQSAWEGLQSLRDDTGAEVAYIESKQSGDFTTNLGTIIDNGNTLCWGIGYACADAVLEAAAANPDVNFACVDNAFSDVPANVTGVVFRAQESSFMVGYIAAAVTETGKVGFVGGIASDVIAQFEYGYKAGVAYANRVLNKNVIVTSQYAESFSDAAKGKSIANKMFTDGCDIVYHAAGGTGTGVIEAAKEAGKFAIGVDRDQAYIAPENVLTSSLKNVDIAVDLVSRQHILGRQIGGKTLSFGLTEDAVGIPEHHENYSDEIYNAAIEIGEKIKSGEIDPPGSEIEFEKYKETLQ
jgi:basic membrane protein A